MVLTRLQKLQRLSANEWWWLVQAVLLLPLTLCGVYWLGVSRWQQILFKLAKSPKTSVPDRAALQDKEAIIRRAQAIARMVLIAAHHGGYRANCLQQTLVLWFLLRRNHLESEIRFGARKQEGQLRAHAWVDCFGIALNEESDVCSHFSPLEGVEVKGVAVNEGDDLHERFSSFEKFVASNTQ